MLFELNAQHSRESQQIMLSKLVLLGALGATHAFVPTNTARVARVILEADVAVEGDTAEPPSAAAVAGVAPNDPGTLSCFVDNQARTLDVATMPGAIPPVGLWDPLGLSKDLSDNELRWYRAAEIKHGRVCMLAFTGWWVQNVCHVTFAGKIASSGTTFKDLDGMDIMKEWDSVPEDGRLQIITTSEHRDVENRRESASRPEGFDGAGAVGGVEAQARRRKVYAKLGRFTIRS